MFDAPTPRGPWTTVEYENGTGFFRIDSTLGYDHNRMEVNQEKYL